MTKSGKTDRHVSNDGKTRPLKNYLRILGFNYYDEEFDRRFTAEYRKKKTQPTRFQFDSCGDNAAARNTVAAGVADTAAEQGAETDGKLDAQRVERIEIIEDSKLKIENYLWRGYDVQSIIDARYADKLPCAEDSNRHKESLKLATDLLLMLDGDKQKVQRIVEAQPWVQEIIEERDENVGQTVESAVSCVAEKEKKYAGSLPSKAMQEAVRKVAGKDYREIVNQGDRSLDSDGKAENHGPVPIDSLNSQLDNWGMEIESMFDDFPLLRDVCAGLKRSQYPAAVFTAGGALMTLMTRCTYRFYHRPERERRLNCSLLIIGHPASNKSMADDICDILMAPVEAADKAGLAALNRYKQDQKKKAANKEGKDKPQGIIRIHPARTSNGQLIQDMLNPKPI